MPSAVKPKLDVRRGATHVSRDADAEAAVRAGHALGVSPQMEEAIHFIEWHRIIPMPGQPRTEGWQDAEDEALAHDILVRHRAGEGRGGSGILQPLGGRVDAGGLQADGSVSPDSRVHLTWGERRYRAVERNIRLHRWSRNFLLPVVLETATNRQSFSQAFAENFFQKQMSPLDTAKAVYKIAEEEGLSVRKCAERFGKPPAWAQLQFDVAKAPAHLQNILSSRKDGLTAVQRLTRIPDERLQKKLARDYVAGKVDQADIWKIAVEAKQQEFANGTRSRVGSPPPKGVVALPSLDVDAYIYNAERNLEDILDAVRSFKTQGRYFAASSVKKWRDRLKELRELTERLEEEMRKTD